MAHVADRAIVQLADAIFQGLAERAQAARGVERLVAHPVERKDLESFKWQKFDAPSLVNRFARVAVLVDQAVGGPGEIVVQGVGGKLRQRANAHVDRVQPVEGLCEMVGQNGNESGGQSALGHEHLPRRSDLGNLPHALGGMDVFGQIEVAHSPIQGNLGCQWIESIVQRGNHAIAAVYGRDQLVGYGSIGHNGLDVGHVPQAVDRLDVNIGHPNSIIACLGKESSNHRTDLAGAEHEHVMHWWCPPTARVFARDTGPL